MTAPDINLLESPTGASHPGRALWIGMTTACLLVGGLWGQAHWQDRALQRAIALESGRLAEITEQRQRLQSATAEPIDHGLQETRLAEELSRIALEMQALAGNGNTRGPAASAVLRALARQSTRQISLTGIRIDAASGHIHLQGEAIRPQAINRFLAGLSMEPAMAGVVWRTIAASRVETAPWKIGFTVESASIQSAPALYANANRIPMEPDR